MRIYIGGLEEGWSMAKKWPFAAAAAAGAAWLFMLAPAKIGKDGRKKFSVKFFAHRGLHTGDEKIPENSIAAFKRAAAEGFGAELDVNLDGDGNVVVFHDDELGRMTGAKGKLNDTPAEELKKLRLLGSDQKIPLLSEVLEVCGGIPLIVELKSTPRYRELCRKTKKLLSKYRGEVVIESFDPRIVAWFRANAKHIVRGQLYARHTGENIKNPLKRFAVNNMLANFLSKPQFIACDYRLKSALPVKICRLFGAASVVWTTRAREETISVLDSDAVIFEQHNPHKL
jgi:glycerophosphoryl diester phosphodiesterase